MRLKQIALIFVISLAVGLHFLAGSFVYAVTCDSLGGSCTNEACPTSAPQQGNEGDYECLPDEVCCVSATPVPEVGKTPTGKSEVTKVVKLENPLTVGASPAEIIGMIIKALLGVVGGVALVMMVWGGFQWLTSAGSPDKVKSGTGTMLWAIIGLILVLASYLLVNTLFDFLGKYKG